MNNRELLDKLVRLVNKEAQLEINRLKAELERNATKGREYANQYDHLLSENAHDLWDFLWAL